MQNVPSLKKCWSRIYDSGLSYDTLKCIPICLYVESMHLQCFPPTRYVSVRYLETSTIVLYLISKYRICY